MSSRSPKARRASGSMLSPKALHVFGLPKRFFTTCGRVAMYFREPHAQVQRTIGRVLHELEATDPAFLKAHFGLRTASGEPTLHLMTEEGFALVALNLTGKLAIKWQQQMLHTYSRMKSDVAQLQCVPPPTTRTLQ